MRAGAMWHVRAVEAAAERLVRVNGLRPRYNERPFTHNIGSAIEGLLESGLLCGEADWALLRAGRRRRVGGAEARRFPARALDAEWGSTERWACLTGTAQLATAWFRLAVTGESRYLRRPAPRIEYLEAIARPSTPADPGIKGGIAGSQPVDGRYVPYQYPNWAAKYFVDALLMDLASESSAEGGAASRE